MCPATQGLILAGTSALHANELHLLLQLYDQHPFAFGNCVHLLRDFGATKHLTLLYRRFLNVHFLQARPAASIMSAAESHYTNAICPGYAVWLMVRQYVQDRPRLSALQRTASSHCLLSVLLFLLLYLQHLSLHMPTSQTLDTEWRLSQPV